MKCPKCGNETIKEWEYVWINSKGQKLMDIVYHCDNCDHDMAQVINDKGEEIERKQFFFG